MLPLSALRANSLTIACCLLGLLIATCNPNYRWSSVRDEPLGADFLQEWTAGSMLVSGAGQQIYNLEAFNAAQHDAQQIGFHWSADQYYPAVYPPTYYLLVTPLALLPYWLAVYVWLALLLAAYAWSAHTLNESQAEDARTIRMPRVFWIVGLILPATFFGLVLGQKGTLWFSVLAISFSLLRSQRTFAAGLVAALLTVKPTLALVIPVAMLLNRQWRFSGGFIAGAVGLLVLSLGCAPASMWYDYIQVVLGSATYQAHGGYHSGWSTSILSALKFIGLQGMAVWIAYLLLAGLLVGRLVIRGDHERRTHDTRQPEYWLWMLCATALLSPHAYFYDLVWMLVPIGLLAQRDLRRAMMTGAALWLGCLWAQNAPDGPPVLALVLLMMILVSPSRRWQTLGTASPIGYGSRAFAD